MYLSICGPGYAAGTYYSYYGGSSSVLCLPRVPQWGKYKDSVQSNSYVYGAEYKVAAYASDPIFKTDNSAGKSLIGHDVPCALCLAAGQNVAHNFPAKHTCPDGWTEEYKGYLMSESSNGHGRVDAICVDEAPAGAVASHAIQHGVWFTIMEAFCGSLPCPKYVHGRELTCVVCSL